MTSPHPPAAAPIRASSAVGGESTTLTRDLADFLIELAIALHKNSIYPQGHPLLANAVAGVHRRLIPLLRERPTLSLGVARHQLVIEGVATDANNPVLRELAGRLHRHHLGAVRFQGGVAESEIAEFLRTVAEDAGRTERPLGLEPVETLARWPNVRLLPMTFEQLQLLDERDTAAVGGGPEEETQTAAKKKAATDANTRAAQLWIGLARAALVTEHRPDAEPPSTDPAVVAKAIDEHGRDVAYDQVVVGYLLQIAQELRARQGREALALRRRISQLVGTLQPATLRRLLDMGGDFTQRRRFVLDATAGMAVDAVVDLVQAAAETSQQTISHSMMRLLSKFAAHAEAGTVPARPQADGALRDHVGRLLSEWNLEDPNPDAYRRTLEGMAHAPAVFETAEHAHPPEPERVVQMSLEVGVVGEALWRAVDAMAARPDFGTLLDVLERAPESHAREAVWGHVATAERLRAVLASHPLQPALAARLTTRLGLAAAPPLLDALETMPDDVARPIADLLVPLGAECLPLLAPRLEGARWMTQRRLLAVVARLPEAPGFAALPWLQHPDDSVRREALRIALRSPTERGAALRLALHDTDLAIVRGALATALTGCPADVAATLMRKVEEGSLPAELRPLGVRVIATLAHPDARDWLVRLATVKGGMMRRPKLRPRSPEMVAAVEGLAARWRGDAGAAAVLQLAARSDDPELRAAAAPRRPSVALREALDAALDAAEREGELRSPPRDTPPHAHRRQAS